MSKEGEEEIVYPESVSFSNVADGVEDESSVKVKKITLVEVLPQKRNLRGRLFGSGPARILKKKPKTPKVLGEDDDDEEISEKKIAKLNTEDGEQESGEEVERERSEKADDEEEEDYDGDEDSHRRKKPVSNNNKVSEYEEDLEYERDRADSVAIDIEEEIVDVLDGKSQKQSNTLAAKKTVAQGMMDIALITANANQLRYIIEFNRHSSTFYINVILISLSLLLQVGVGLALIFKGRLDLRGQSKEENAKRLNNYVVVGIFLVTIINVFIASFTVTGGGSSV